MELLPFLEKNTSLFMKVSNCLGQQVGAADPILAGCRVASYLVAAGCDAVAVSATMSCQVRSVSVSVHVSPWLR